ncbi:MAG: radical SAM protein, partial [Candidatus Korarchaeota archaeon]|nr:radical SAM protein [Candidatus Korarchaeota archaeon]
MKGLCGLALSVPRGRVARCPPTPREILNRYRASGRHLEGYGEPWALRFYVEVVRGCSNFYRTLLRLPDGRKCVLCDLCRSGPLGARVSCPIGIPAGCGYCGVPEIYGPPRSRDPRVVASEIRELVDHGATRIVLSAPDILDYGRDLLVDPLPLTDPRSPPPNLEALEELFETILAVVPEARDGDVVVFIENIKPNLVDERVAELLGRYFKGTPVHIGVETGDPEHARALGRPASPEEALRAARLLRRHGMRPYVYFIHGLPGQTLTTARRTVSLMKKLGRAGVEKVTVERFTPLPGTAFQDMPPAPPAYRDKASLMIVREASRINIEAKR